MASRDVELNLIGNDRTGAATRSAGSNLDQLGRKLSRFNATAKRSMGRAGIDAGQSFVAGFISAVTLGRLGAGITRLSPGFSALGTRLGGLLAVGLAGAFLAQAGTIIAAGLPLILGVGLLAGPVAFLLKNMGAQLKEADKHAAKAEALKKRIAATDDKAVKAQLRKELANHQTIMGNLRERAKGLATLKARARDFMMTISAPLRLPLDKSLKAVGDGLTKLEGPTRRLMKGLSAGMVPFVKGVMGGLTAFVTALLPAMPGITAGLKEWGKQAPKIGKGIGDAIAKLLEDPEGVKDAVEGMADGLIAAADAATDLANALITISAGYRTIAGVVDQFEQSTGGEGGPLAGIANNIKRVGNSIGAVLIPAFNRGTTAAGNFVSRVPGILASLPGRAAGAIRGLGNAIGGVAIPAFNRGTTAARNLVSRVPGILRSLPGRAAGAIRTLGNSIGRVFIPAANRASTGARNIVSRTAAALRPLPGRAASAISGLAGRIGSTISRAVGAARSAASRVVSGVVSTFASLPGRVMAAIGNLGSRIAGAVGGIVSSARARLSGLPGFSAGAGGFEFAVLAGGGRTGGPMQVNVAAPIVDVRAYLGDQQLDAVIRATIVDENRRTAHRARVGRR